MRFFHRLGFGIQSPWAYDFVTNVLFDKSHYYAFDSLKHQYPKHTKSNEQLFRLALSLKPTTVAIIASNTSDKQIAASRAYMLAASKELQIDTIVSTPTQPFNLLFIVDAQQYNLTEWISAGLQTEDTYIIIEDIGNRNKVLWQQFMQLPITTATFDIANKRGIIFFNSKRTKIHYKV